MGLWKHLVPDLKVDKLIDMSDEELTKIEAVVNSGVIDSGGRILDTVMSPSDGSTVNVVMINSTVSLSAPSPVRPLYYRRRRDIDMSTADLLGDEIDARIKAYLTDLDLGETDSLIQTILMAMFGVVLLCQFIR